MMTEQDINQERLELALEAAGLDLWENDLLTGQVVRKASKIFAELGYSGEELFLYMDDTFRIIHPDDVGRIAAAIDAHLKGETVQYRCEFRVRAKSGVWVWYANYGRIMDREASISGRRFIGVTFNIDDRKRQEEMLLIREQEWRALVENSPDTIARYDNMCRRIYVNPALAAMVEGGADALLGKTPSEYPGGINYLAYETHVQKVIATGEAVECELNFTALSGKVVCSHLRLTAERDASGAVVTVLAVGRDISELNVQRQKVHEMALYDVLTGLPNRRLLLDRLQHAQASSLRSGLKYALMFIDLDNFKIVNDTLGHGVGDLLLQQVAQRLAAAVRQEDTVARMGGDEFVIVLEHFGMHDQEVKAHVQGFGNKLMDVLSTPYQIANQECHSTASIGAVVLQGDQISVDDMMRRADIAMYQAKHVGRNTIRFFDLEMQRAIESRAVLEDSIKHALSRREFVLAYQPQVDAAGLVVAVEVLLRWQHEHRGLLLPADFISTAEEIGAIVPIGLWVLKSACCQLKIWQQSEKLQKLGLAVNVSARQFQQQDFVGQVIEIIESTGVDPTLITLELTESMVVSNTADAAHKMQLLKKKGIKFAMDDFGTGHSSFSNLKKLPFDQLKIDRSFVQDVVEHNDAAAIVKTIITMANNLGMEVIAEGVETKAQKDFLVHARCLNFQGYLFGQPVPAQEFEVLLEQSVAFFDGQ